MSSRGRNGVDTVPVDRLSYTITMRPIIPARDALASTDPVAELKTTRLILRQWRAEDAEPFAALNADPQVMRYLPRLLARAESDAFAQAAAATLRERGFGLWAVEVAGGSPFIGYVGLNAPSFTAHFTPCVEIGWRLERASWGAGYASEAAAQCLRHAFESLALPEVVSFTVPANERSLAVMRRIGMQRDAGGDFEHPRLPPAHPLRAHVLYRLSAAAWAARAAAAHAAR